MRDTIRQAANIILAVAQIAVSVVAGKDIGPTSDRYPTYVLPAGYAFAIWGLIFGGTLGYAVYQLLPAQREKPLFRRIGWPAASSFLANCVWVIVFPRGLFVLSVAVIVWLLASVIFVVAGIYRQPIAGMTFAERWLVYATFSVFLGWVSVATTVNIAQTLSAESEVKSWGPGVWWGVGVLLVVGAVAAAVTARLRANFFFAITVVWALVAVTVNQLTNDAIPNSPTVAAAGGVAAAMVISALLIGGSTRGAGIANAR